jgi:hypothetical protein
MGNVTPFRVADPAADLGCIGSLQLLRSGLWQGHAVKPVPVSFERPSRIGHPGATRRAHAVFLGPIDVHQLTRGMPFR